MNAGRAIGLAGVAAALLAWGVAARFVPPYMIPGPWAVLRETGMLLWDPTLRGHVLASMWHVGASLPIAVLLGSLLSLLAYYVPATALMVHGRISPFLNAFSSIGWTMLAVLWFGLNGVTVVFAITAIILPVSILNVQAGLATIDVELTEMSRSFTRRRMRTFLLVVLPALAPFLFAAIRISFGIAWKVALTAELFGGNSGLGFLVNLARQSLDTAQIFAVIAVIVLISVLTETLVLAPVQASLSRHYAHE